MSTHNMFLLSFKKKFQVFYWKNSALSGGHNIWVKSKVCFILSCIFLYLKVIESCQCCWLRVHSQLQTACLMNHLVTLYNRYNKPNLMSVYWYVLALRNMSSYAVVQSF